jgi:hypothetical protein
MSTNASYNSNLQYKLHKHSRWAPVQKGPSGTSVLKSSTTHSFAINSLFNKTFQQSIPSFTMKLNFLLAAAFVAAPVLAASSTTETHTSTKYVLIPPERVLPYWQMIGPRTTLPPPRHPPRPPRLARPVLPRPPRALLLLWVPIFSELLELLASSPPWLFRYVPLRPLYTSSVHSLLRVWITILA